MTKMTETTAITSPFSSDFVIEAVAAADLASIVEIDAIHSGTAKPDYWTTRLAPFLAGAPEATGADVAPRLGFVARNCEQLVGYILAEGRAWEFGSPLCGWIYAIGIHPEHARRGVALALCRRVCSRFKALGIHTVRTMVRKDDVDVLSFFRASGFRAGPYIELEVGL